MGEKQIFERKEDLNNHSSEPLSETTAQAIIFAQLPDNRHQLPLLKGSPENRSNLAFLPKTTFDTSTEIPSSNS